MTPFPVLSASGPKRNYVTEQKLKKLRLRFLFRGAESDMDFI